MSELKALFDDLAATKSIFKDKSVLQSGHTPEIVPHREKQIEAIANILAPALRGERASNLFLYGQTGTGKTLSIQFVRNEMLKRAGDSLRIEYLNCKLKKVADTEYRILAQLTKIFGGSVPATGLPTEEVYNRFLEVINKQNKLCIIIFDEIDQAVNKISDNFLYNLTRLNSELTNTQISIIGISNDLQFLDNLDPRVKSSLGEEEVVFHPYNALQLQEILQQRAKSAFIEGILEEGVISKCAAFAAREHGDARRALDLMRIAGELAERDKKLKVGIDYVDKANSKMDKDKIIDTVEFAPRQLQLTLYSIILLYEKKRGVLFSGEIYQLYEELCKKTKTEILTQRRVGDLVGELEMLSLINADVVSRGRYGKTREITLRIQQPILQKVKQLLSTALSLSDE
ncbi:MAG: orc1/cdc6 family replication initiation protein [Nanoarchaeota archaeon]